MNTATYSESYARPWPMTARRPTPARLRERREIRSRATLAGFLRAYGQGVAADGAESEWLAAEGCAQREIPLSMLVEPEVRATVSPGPTDADTVDEHKRHDTSAV